VTCGVICGSVKLQDQGFTEIRDPKALRMLLNSSRAPVCELYPSIKITAENRISLLKNGRLKKSKKEFVEFRKLSA
jgi:hypothetical protein